MTRERADRALMLRFVVGPDRVIVPDLLARLPGRGFWLCPRPDVIEAAAKRGAFARAARGPVSLPPDIVETIRAGLTRRIVDLLGLARRAGQAVGGFVKAREALSAGRAGLVVQAWDGSEEECRRLLSGFRDTAVVRPLSAVDLGGAFGRDHLVHVAVAPGRLAQALEAECIRHRGFAATAGRDVCETGGDGSSAGPRAQGGDDEAARGAGQLAASMTGRCEVGAGQTIERTGE